MFSLPENASPNPALRAQLEAQLGFVTTLSQRAIELLARMSELNLQITRHTLETALDTGRQLAACTDPMQLVPTAMRGWQPLGEQLRNYQHSLMGVIAEAQTGLGQAAAQAPNLAQHLAQDVAQSMAQGAAHAMAHGMAPDGAAGAGQRHH